MTQQLLTILSAAFWGVLVLSLLVTAHEAGHYFAARGCHARVTEFFIGLPSRWRLAYRSKKHGTQFGITPILLGGYTRICGMGAANKPYLAEIFAYVQEHGRASVSEVVAALGCTEDEAYDAFELLVDWASLEAAADEQPSEQPAAVPTTSSATLPETYRTTLRDAALRTQFDDGFDRSSRLYEPGSLQPLPMPAEEFLQCERANTYCGKGFWQRFAMIFAGPVASLITGVLLMVLAMSVLGRSMGVNTNTLGTVDANSLAAKAGLASGDTIVAINDTKVSSFSDISVALRSGFSAKKPFTITYTPGGGAKDVAAQKTVTITPTEHDKVLGIRAPVKHVRLPLADSVAFTFDYVVQVGKFALKLITPTQTIGVVSQSSSVIGISLMASQAAASGISELFIFAAMISISLALMNILPIPPLDGGKLFIECIQALMGRPLSEKTQMYFSYVGVALFFLLFIAVVGNDILRLL